jgi:autotransporter-associated beta strand protein
MRIMQSLVTRRSFNDKIILSALRSRAWAFLLSAAAILTLLLSTASSSVAGSASWNLNPTSNDWNTAENWTPNTVPNGPTDVATFGTSNTDNISVSVETQVDSIIFNPGASGFSITANPAVSQSYLHLTISGAGITNNSGVPQNFVAAMDPAGNGSSIDFTNSATTGSLTSFTTEANPTGDFAWGAYISFQGSASAGDGTFYNNGSAVDGSAGGVTIFSKYATAGNGTFFSGGGTVSGAGGSTTWFNDHSDAGNAVITCNGGTVSGAGGGIISFAENASLSNATLIVNGGVNGGEGGAIWFDLYHATNGNRVRVELFGNGIMRVDQAGLAGVDIGSLEGDGIVFLGSRELTVGRNHLSTTFSGLIEGDGYGRAAALSKIGQGTLTLSGANTYTGTTTVFAGGLIVGNTTGSATGTSALQVEGGTLGGNGSIDGAVSIGTGSGTGAFLEPSAGTSKPTTLTIQKALTFKADATYSHKLNSRQAKADMVIAKVVTIESGAAFSMSVVGRGILNAGTVFTVISNTSRNPIAGTFANLADGSTFTAGRNNFQVSYEGGTGNDLTLTVVP